MRRSLRATGSAVVVMGWLSAGVSPALAEGVTKQQCVDAHVSSQKLRRDGRLRDARAALLTCASEACPRVIVSECARMLAEVEGQLPSVVLVVQAADGTDVVDAKVSIDGRTLDALDGRPVDVDPGEHVLRCERSGAKPIEQQIVVRVGERARRVVFRFDPPAVAAASAPSRPIPAAFWALGAVGVAAAGVGAGFEIDGLTLRSALAATHCDPRCAPSSLSPITRSFLVGDVTLGAGIASLVAAAVVFAVRPSAPPPSAALVPLEHGLALRVGGAF